MLKSWIIYGFCMIVSIITCLAKGGFISAMIFYMLILIPIVSLLHLLFTLTNFKVGQKLDKRSYVKGEFLTYQYQIYNPTIIAFCPISIRFCGDQILFKGSELSTPDQVVLGPFGLRDGDIQVECKYRGNYFVGVDRIILRDFLKLFKVTFNSIDRLKILVYPLVREIQKLSIGNNLNEVTESVICFDKFDASVFCDVRDYVPGDPLKRIHWNLSSKMNHLITKELEGNVNNKTKIMLNTELLDATFEENIVIQEYVVESAVAMIKFLLENNTAIEFTWFKFELFKVTGTMIKDFPKFFDALALLAFSKGRYLQDVVMHEMEMSNGPSNYILITPYISTELSNYLMIKKRQNYQISIFIVDTEYNGHVEYLKEFPIEPMIECITKGIKVYKIIFENGVCRMEVAS